MAAYDNYDYPAYWKDREYEHKSEGLAIAGMLSRIKRAKKIMEIGAGFGRLTPFYNFRGKKLVLVEPSGSLIKIARKKFKKEKNITFVKSTIQNLNKKYRPNTFDLILMVRVLHHIEDLDACFSQIKRLLVPGGYFILEFPNKIHWKAIAKNFAHGNFIFPLDIFPFDRRSKKSKAKKDIPFINYHPDIIKHKLVSDGFELLEARSVSNIRSSFLKRNVPINVLLILEKAMQKPMASINFGPSVFLLLKT